MADPLTDAVLAWLHIFSAIGWMGTSMFLVMVMSPILPTLSAQTRGELILKLFPRMIRFAITFATLTVVLGVILAFSKVGGNLSLLSPNNFWGLNVTIGATTALLAYIIALAIVLPSMRRVTGLVQQMQQTPQQGPPAQMATLQKRMKIGSATALALLSLSLIFMVAAARLPPI
ncbi:MAG: hypothetical protein HY619_00775 [Thaumarchaeota archaeon]|nr:hypothetical protein [Nitrososphaerota archaeon]